MQTPLFVTFAGHRRLENFELVEARLTELVGRLAGKNELVEFSVGNDGEFDILAASVVRRVRRTSGSDNCVLNLVLPYPRVGMEEMSTSFDSIIIPDELYGVHPKRAITLRNRWMVERCDLLICCVTREAGGAAATLAYAEKLGREVCNIV